MLEAPAAWARLEVLNPALLALLQPLSRGCSVVRLQKLLPLSPGLAEPFVQTLAWCGLLAEPGPQLWAAHELLFHSRTRRGFARAPVGRQDAAGPRHPMPEGPRHALVRGKATELGLSLAQVLTQRQSRREHAAAAKSLADLGRFLWHSLAEQHRAGEPHRPYPSGGRCYALRPYLVVSRCAGLDAGLYAYDAQAHELIQVGPLDASQRRLLQDAASSAQARTEPQALVVLCADVARVRQAYAGLSYSLVLKEVGVLMQTAQLVATALGLACCPLGTGDSLLFAAASATDAWSMPSVGEWLLGAPA